MAAGACGWGTYAYSGLAVCLREARELGNRILLSGSVCWRHGQLGSGQTPAKKAAHRVEQIE